MRNLLPEDWQAKLQHPDLASLTIWAVEARYPGDSPEAVEADAHAALEQAAAVCEAVENDLAVRASNDVAGKE